ncbi:MAG: GntR family transcriptional regulator, partial [Pseudomonadota bacterium]
EPNKGYFVGEITETEARELYEMREALEIFNIPSIIKNLKPEDLNEIKKSFKDHSRSRDPESRRLLILKDAQFHMKMAEYGNNKVIYKQLKGALEEICLKYRPEYMGEERINDAISEHRAILTAIEKRDADSAITSMKGHIRKGMEYVINSLKQRNRHILF